MARFEKEKELFFEEVKTRYKTIKPEFQKKLNRYDKIWEKAERIAEQEYSKKMTNKTMSQIVRDFVDEFYSYQGSILKSFRNLKTRTFEENLARAKELRVKGRLKQFLNDFGNETFTFDYEFNGKSIQEELTLRKWIDRYLDHRITKEELWQIIDNFKESNDFYLKEFYGNSANSSATLQEKAGLH